MSLDDRILSRLRTLVAEAEHSDDRLTFALDMLAKYRCSLIQNTLIQENGTTVRSGPFSGMKFLERTSEGCYVPKLLGCYEQELHDFLFEIPDRGYDAVINIGCAEGYYAVGIKTLLPDASVHAYDIDSYARSSCAYLASRNGVQVEIGGQFAAADFEKFAGKRVLVWCDIEGAEVELLDPRKSPSLGDMDLVVELHRAPAGHAADLVPPRFAASHDIDVLHPRAHSPDLPDWLQGLSDLDQLLAQWEWRSAPTPWAVMKARR